MENPAIDDSENRPGEVSGSIRASPAIGRALLISLAGNGTTLALGVITGVVTARALGPTERGVLVAIILWTTMISWLSLRGLDDALVYTSRGVPETLRSVRRSLRRTLSWGAVAGIGSAVLINMFIASNFGQGGAVIAALCILPSIPLHVVSQLSLSTLLVHERYLVWNVLRTAPSLTYALLLLLLLSTSNLTLATGVASFAGGAVVAAVASFVAVRRMEGNLSHAEVDDLRSTRNEALRYGWKATGVNFPYVANQRLDQLILGLGAAPASLGVYAVAVSISSVLQVIGNTLQAILFPRFVKGQGNGSVAKILALAIAGTTLAAIPLAIVADPLVSSVYGSEYSRASDVLRVLLIGVIFLVGSGVLTAEAKAEARFRVLIAGQAWGASITIVGFVVLVPIFGIIGAAMTSSLAYANVFLVLLLTRSRKNANNPRHGSELPVEGFPCR